MPSIALAPVVRVACPGETLVCRTPSQHTTKHKCAFNMKELRYTLKENVRYVMENSFVLAIFSLFIAWALFGDDIRLAEMDPSADYACNVVMLILFCVFLVEFFITCFYDENYFKWPVPFLKSAHEPLWAWLWRLLSSGNFYFWLDLISVASFVSEISWLWGSYPGGGDETIQSAKAGRGAKIGAKAGRIIRLFRLVRLLKYLTLRGKPKQNQVLPVNDTVTDTGDVTVYSSADNDLEECKYECEPQLAPAREKNHKNRTKEPNEVSAKETEKQSKVGSAMADLTTKRAIILIIGMLASVQQLLWLPQDNFPRLSLAIMSRMQRCQNFDVEKCANVFMVSTNFLISQTHLIRMRKKEQGSFHTIFEGVDANDRRNSEILSIDDMSLQFHFDKQEQSESEAIMGICLTCVVIGMLLVSYCVCVCMYVY